ncbi:MAG: hypothetical protein ACM338_09975 [Betaproteobacteria bacterium]
MVQRVNIGGPAHLYTNAIPADLMVIGTVTRKSGATGALVRDRAGAFAQLNGRVLRPLDKREVISAMIEARVGRISRCG